MAAQSPPLSATLSGMEAGVRGAALCVKTTPDTGEQREERGAEGEADERRHGVGEAQRVLEEVVEARDAQQRQAGHRQAGDGAAVQGELEGGGQAAPPPG